MRPSLRWTEPLRDYAVRAVIVLVAVVVGGFVLLAVGWRGAARTLYVPLQVPWLVSGGIAALAVAGTALGALSIHLGRRADAAHRAAVDDLVHDIATYVDEVRTGARTLKR